MHSAEIYDRVRDRYTAAAQSQRDDQAGSRAVAQKFGYSLEELNDIPEDANLGLSCGNPHALANLEEGETVCDLGSGAGFDVFLAAKKVGPRGRAIGVDFNDAMLEKANTIKQSTNASNVSFVKSSISQIDIEDNTVDCMISNCVINLVPEEEKHLVFGEMYRILKPGGRVAVSDVLVKRELPPEIKNDMALYVGCVAGASHISGYERYLAEAGFRDVLIVDSGVDLNAFKQSCGGKCCGTGQKSSDVGTAGSNMDLNRFAGSFKIFAIK